MTFLLIAEIMMTVLLLILSMFLSMRPDFRIGFVEVLILVMIILQAAIVIELYHQFRIVRFLKEHSQPKPNLAAAEKFADDDNNEARLRKQIELSSLQSQINPHFLYNTLDSIRSKALFEGQTEIADMTEILSNFFRYCIGDTEKLVKVKIELDHIRDYYFIQKFRFEDRFDMEIIMENDEINDLYIPKMTLQPLVENAMIHGIERINRKGLLQIRLYQTDHDLLISVSDNGAGMTHDQLCQMNEQMEHSLVASHENSKHTGIGVKNVNTRIMLMFGEQYGIHYQSVLNNGTNVIVRIPVINDFNRIKFEG